MLSVRVSRIVYNVVVFKEKTMSISVGDRVRSFDFAHSRDVAGKRSCYVEGHVVEVGHTMHESINGSCPRYSILVDLEVFGGEDVPNRRVGQHVYPPVNGMPKSFGGVTDFVELV